MTFWLIVIPLMFTPPAHAELEALCRTSHPGAEIETCEAKLEVKGIRLPAITVQCYLGEPAPFLQE